MDDAEDGNIWLSFPSSDRNKVDIDTFLILKKGTESQELVEDQARYKILAIENEAPDYVKGKDIVLAHISNTAGTGTSGSFSSGADTFGDSNGIGFPMKGFSSINVTQLAWETNHGLHES